MFPNYAKPITDTYLTLPQGSNTNPLETTQVGSVQGTTTTAPQTTLDGGANTSTYTAPTAEQIAAAKANVTRSDAKSKLDAYNALFGGLFGKIDTAAADQAATTRSNYGAQRTDLTEQFNQELPGLDMSYYLGGVGDSSLRLAGRGQAERALKKSLGTVDAGEATDLASIGQTAATKRAGYAQDQSNIDLIRQQLDNTTDPAELEQLQNDIQAKIGSINAASAGFETGGVYRQQLADIAPTRDLSPIKATLTSLVNGAANPALKRQIASQIIDNADLSPDQTKQLYDQFINSVA